MQGLSRNLRVGVIQLGALATVTVGCAGQPTTPPPGPDLGTPPTPRDLRGPDPDLTLPPTTGDGGVIVGPDLADPSSGEASCGDLGPCRAASLGPPGAAFPLQSDPAPRPNQLDNGVARDPNGFLGLSSTHSSFDFLWVANTNDWNVGTVSKLNSRGVREIARYFTVTCWSNPGGHRGTCDGNGGCCARDDHDRFLARESSQPQPARQSIQRTKNDPSRTAVDFDGAVWIANRAFGGQPSVTKIAHDLSECVERNGTAGLQTSRDRDGDGLIDTDCNRNGFPDDVADVGGTPCSGGRDQEFFGFDDECVLLTTNVDVIDTWGRPIALGRGADPNGPSDAWMGTWREGHFFRVDGKTGLVQQRAQVPGNPYGAIVDASGILWSPRNEGSLSWLDTRTGASGEARTPSGYDLRCYGVALDRDQNVWCGGWMTGQANRYTPDRSAGTSKLGAGKWVAINRPGAGNGAAGAGRGIAVDARSDTSYFAWLARDSGFVVRIPASTLPRVPAQDTILDGSAYPSVRVAGRDTIGVGIDTSQNVWAISQGGSVATRIVVDAAGDPSQPDITTGQTGMGCPVGRDRCGLALAGRGPAEPGPYTYSDFTGFGLRNFTAPRGTYQWVQTGCTTGEGVWYSVAWEADVPPGTTLTMRARTGATPVPGAGWSPWTRDFATSPADLRGAGGLAGRNDTYLEVEFDFASDERGATPSLRRFTIYYKCEAPIP